VPIALQIPVAQVIAQNDHDIGSFLILGVNGQAGKDGDERCENKKPNWNFHAVMQKQGGRNVATKFTAKTISLD
jgi:hypothetical protein